MNQYEMKIISSLWPFILKFNIVSDYLAIRDLLVHWKGSISSMKLKRWLRCCWCGEQLYQMYGRRQSEDVFDIMTKYSVSYIILEDSHCMAPSRNGCRLPDLIDVDNKIVRSDFCNFFLFWYFLALSYGGKILAVYMIICCTRSVLR